MWILLATLDNGLVDAKHFGPHTKTAFWVCVHVSVYGSIFYCHAQLGLGLTGSSSNRDSVWIYSQFAIPNFHP